MKTIVIAGALCAALYGCSEQTNNASTIATQVDRLVPRLPSVGGVIAVEQGGTRIYTKAFGYRDLKARARVDADTRFEIGSVTKQFTAAAILQLKERGKLSLGDSLATYLPQFPHAKEITLRELLYQISGLRDYADAPDFNETMTRSTGSLPRVADYVKGPLDFKPGTKWAYSSTNYYVLGHVIEVVSGEAYDDYVRSHLLRPAGMTHSGFIHDETSMTDVATPYHNDQVARTPESWAGAAGAVVSTAGDMLAWNDALAHGKVVTPSDYTLMTSPTRLPNGTLTDYGMGVSIDTRDGHKRLWHNGATNGCVAIDSVFPQDGASIVVLENSTGGNDPGVVERTVLDALFPDALAASQSPAKGETPKLRDQMTRTITEIFAGTLRQDEVTPSFWRFWGPRRRQIVAYFAPFGAPQREIFKGRFDNGDTIAYVYRVEFRNDVRNCTIELDKKTNLLANLGVQPPG